MTHDEARSLVKKFTYLMGTNLAYNEQVYTVKRFWTRRNGAVATIKIVLKPQHEATLTALDFPAFYKDWKGHQLDISAAQ